MHRHVRRACHFHICAVTVKLHYKNLDQTHVCRHINEASSREEERGTMLLMLLHRYVSLAPSTLTAVSISSPSPSRLQAQKILEFEERWWWWWWGLLEGSSLNAASPQEKIIVSSLPRDMGVFLWPIPGTPPSSSCTAWDVTVVCHNYFCW